MAAQNYSVFVGAVQTVVSLDPAMTLAEARTAISAVNGSDGQPIMSATDNFLYNNPVTSLTTVFWPVSDETNTHVSLIQFPSVPDQGVNNPIIQVVSTAQNDQSLLGTQTQSGFVNDGQYFGVKVDLNMSDAAAITNNSGMFEPIMLENVVSANPDYPVSFEYAVICQKGAIIEFIISCWGAVGMGYTITSTMTTSTDICSNPLYVCQSGPGMITGSLRRYNSSGGDTIQIEANQALGIASQYNIQYSTVTVTGWSINSYEDSSGNTHTDNTPVPVGPQGQASASSEFISLIELPGAQAGGGFQPPPPAGNTSIPGGTTQPAAPTAGPPSQQQFGTISNIQPGGIPNTSSQGLVGAIQLFFLVFDSLDDANTVMKILNSGTMSVVG